MVVPGDSAAGEVRQRCQRQARLTLANRGWKLVLDETSFLEEVITEVETLSAHAPQPAIELLAEQATIRRYGRVWYTACRLDRTIRQARAWEELHALLYRTALNRLDHDRSSAEECAQAAMFKAWQKLDQLDNPGSFMWWALAILRNEINRSLAAGKRRVADRLTGEKSWQEVEVSDSDLRSREPLFEAEAPVERGPARLNGTSVNHSPRLTEDRQARLESAIRACLDNERHRAVFIKTFLDGKGRQEIAAELNITPEIVSVFKQRALRRLQGCEEFLAVLEELL
jgi:RNA polymerase sigma factor (sigma-70 family)